ncbi:alpha-N-acetylgalactosamine-specific lectin-like [Acanthaster planci]|uniref:Alpha-N-acetylgalactosamine-specific lectin-like n=1 Tax=Acanthaster planci TaxID=133434 RepID=A0A8B7YYT6_ACAPL|nr:alpha-N-acetylgalactosamine-specific lectin-like [Acanthaster planci]
MALWLRLSFLSLVIILGMTQADECPPFWTRFQNNCYRFMGHNTTWQASEDHCQEFFTRYGQSHLASVHSQAEYKFLMTMWKTSARPPHSALWLGASKVHDDFVWADGTQFDYTAWHTGEPNNARGQENCVVSWIDDWNDTICSRSHPHICKVAIA